MGANTSRGPDAMEDIRGANSLSLVDLLYWQTSMLQNSKNKKTISEKEFVRQYSEAFKSGNASSFAKNVFRRLDLDGSGTIDINEFVLAMSSLTSDDVDEKIDWAFKFYDINGDGYISREELRKIVGPIFKMQARGKVNKKDIEKQVNDLFASMNTDCDFGITIEEFRQGFRKHPFLIQCLRL